VNGLLLLALAGTFTLTSPAFTGGAGIPARFTCAGADVSPPLAWGSAPEKTRSFVLIVDDPDAPGRSWLHWLVYDIPPGLRQLGEDAARRGIAAARQGRNDFGRPTWGGPCPPSGRHRYYFRLRALDVGGVGLGSGATREEVERRVEGHVLGEAVLMGTYGR
jgi:Raf kinase inhibitor-like YbhB/YbcL family protein